MKLTIDQIPCDLDPSQRIALDYDAQDLADVRSGNKGTPSDCGCRQPGPTTAFSDSPPSLTRASASMPRSTRPF